MQKNWCVSFVHIWVLDPFIWIRHFPVVRFFFFSHFVDSNGDIYSVSNIKPKNGNSNRSRSHHTNNEVIYDWHVIKANEFWNFHPTSSRYEHYIVQLQCHWHLFRFFLLWFGIALLCFVSNIEIDFSGCDMRFSVMNPDQNAILTILYCNSMVYTLGEGERITEFQPDIKLFRFTYASLEWITHICK